MAPKSEKRWTHILILVGCPAHHAVVLKPCEPPEIHPCVRQFIISLPPPLLPPSWYDPCLISLATDFSLCFIVKLFVCLFVRLLGGCIRVILFVFVKFLAYLSFIFLLLLLLRRVIIIRGGNLCFSDNYPINDVTIVFMTSQTIVFFIDFVMIRWICFWSNYSQDKFHSKLQT